MRSATPSLLGAASAVLWLISLAACSDDSTSKATASAASPASTALARIGDGPHPVVQLDLGELGRIRIELYPELAPATVDNFLKLVEQGFYDGTKFHRVIPGFIIQGGDPNTRKPDPRSYGRGNPGYAIEDEFSDFPHLRGTVAMANRGAPRTAGSQFFIVHQDARALDGAYTAFGRVIEGIEVVDAVTEVEIDKYGRYGPTGRPYPVDVVLLEATSEEPSEVARSAPAPPDDS